MRIYLHYEASPDFTQVIQVDSDNPKCTIGEAVGSFIKAYNAKHGHVNQLNQDRLSIWSEKKKQVQPGSRIAQAFTDREDVYLVSNSPHETTPSSAKEPSTVHDPPAPSPHSCSLDETAQRMATSLSLQPSPLPPRQSEPAVQSEPSSSLRAGSAAQLDLPAILQSSLDKAEEAMKASNLRLARAIYEQILQLVPNCPPVLAKLARLCLGAGRAAEAVEHARAALQHGPATSAALQLLGEALSAAGRGEEAVRQLEAALAAAGGESAARQGDVKLALAKALNAAYLAALEQYDSNDSDSDGDQGPSINKPAAGSGAPAAAAGFRRMLERCVQLVMSLVSEDPGNWEGLFLYASLAMERGMLEDAVRVALRLLTQRSSDARIKALLAQCLMLPEGLPLLLAELGGGGGTGAAMAFLANCVKDQGAVTAAVELFSRAVAAEPLNGSYLLNFVHALELDQEYDRLCGAAAGFCARCSLQLAGPLQHGLGSLVAALHSLPPLGQPTSLAWLTAQAYHPDQPSGSAGGAAASSPQPGHLDALDDAIPKVEYSPEQLDLLGSLFTLVKVTYVGGAVACSAQLCRLVNPARLASAVELHTTLVRNEAAYFGCVLQLLRESPPTAVAAAAAAALPPPLYVCGDSHCLAPAWRVVRLRGQARLLQPLLVTGCKIWHLRPASRFYPKLQFLNTIRKLPPGTQLVMLFGEIDCREGLLLAVDKCKYESLEEGINHTLDIYTQLLLELIKERGLELFMHPVLPVLKETRHIVLPFMRAMKRKMLKVAASPAAGGRLHFLDFFDQLLDGSSPPGLKQHLQFDGTHIHPAYVQYLDEALAAVK